MNKIKIHIPGYGERDINLEIYEYALWAIDFDTEGQVAQEMYAQTGAKYEGYFYDSEKLHFYITDPNGSRFVNHILVNGFAQKI